MCDRQKIKNLRVKNLCVLNEQVQNSSIVNANITNLQSDNANITNLQATNGNITNLQVTNINGKDVTCGRNFENDNFQLITSDFFTYPENSSFNREVWDNLVSHTQDQMAQLAANLQCGRLQVKYIYIIALFARLTSLQIVCLLVPILILVKFVTVPLNPHPHMYAHQFHSIFSGLNR